MHLKQIQAIFAALTGRAQAVSSYGHEIYSKVQIVSAENVGKGVELVIRVPTYAIPPDSFGFIQRSALCTLIDASTSISAWVCNPEHRISVSINMSYSFFRDATATKEIMVKSRCEDVMGSLGYTVAEVRQNDDLLISAKHTVFFLDKTVKSVFNIHM